MLGFAWIIATTLTIAGGPRAIVANDSAHCANDERRITAAEIVPANRTPFADGEALDYSVSFTKLHVGSGGMHIVADTLRGARVWRATFNTDGGIPFFSVHDTNTSWFDPETFNSLRFAQQLHEPRGRHVVRDFQIFPDRRLAQSIKGDEHETPADPMDEVAIVYFVRTLPLEPGQCYELRRYFEPKGNPVVIHVERRERITVPAGTFDAIVLRPEITTSAIFSQNGRAELWLSDDPRHLVLQLKSHLSFGSINLYLKSVSGAATR